MSSRGARLVGTTGGRRVQRSARGAAAGDLELASCTVPSRDGLERCQDRRGSATRLRSRAELWDHRDVAGNEPRGVDDRRRQRAGDRGAALERPGREIAATDEVEDRRELGLGERPACGERRAQRGGRVDDPVIGRDRQVGIEHAEREPRATGNRGGAEPRRLHVGSRRAGVDRDELRDRLDEHTARDIVQLDRERGLGGGGAERQRGARTPAVRRGDAVAREQPGDPEPGEQRGIERGVLEIERGLLHEIAAAAAPGRRIERMRGEREPRRGVRRGDARPPRAGPHAELAVAWREREVAVDRAHQGLHRAHRDAAAQHGRREVDAAVERPGQRRLARRRGVRGGDAPRACDAPGACDALGACDAPGTCDGLGAHHAPGMYDAGELNAAGGDRRVVDRVAVERAPRAQVERIARRGGLERELHGAELRAGERRVEPGARPGERDVGGGVDRHRAGARGKPRDGERARELPAPAAPRDLERAGGPAAIAGADHRGGELAGIGARDQAAGLAVELAADHDGRAAGMQGHSANRECALGHRDRAAIAGPDRAVGQRHLRAAQRDLALRRAWGQHAAGGDRHAGPGL